MINIYIYQRIRDLREDEEKTQAQIAEMLGTGVTTYRRWETGEREIPLHVIIELAKHYKVSLDYIAGLTKNKEQNWKKNNFTNIGTINGNITMK